jgi:hypothetical protein
MCWMDRKESRKLRWMHVLANASLALGLLLRLFVHPTGTSQHAALDFAVGLLLGVSIAVNFHVVLLRKRRREDRA